MKTKNIIFISIAILLLALTYFLMRAPKEETNSPLPQGKLNIDAVCEGALAYMTFPSGAESDKFVAECKEGKHPEVIEKYKKDMNLGDGATI